MAQHIHVHLHRTRDEAHWSEFVHAANVAKEMLKDSSVNGISQTTAARIRALITAGMEKQKDRMRSGYGKEPLDFQHEVSEIMWLLKR